jgi:ATP-dependent helicase/nuclease subunit B
MAVTFVLGRAGAGKTHYCVAALLAQLDEAAGDNPLILLVPEQASFQMERALATQARRGGYCRAQVLSFTRLTQRVLQETGDTLVHLSSQARSMALRAAAERMGRSLRYFRRAAQSQGFFTQAGRLIEQLLLENVSWVELARAARAIPAGSARRKVAELARLYREHLEWLGTERLDPALRLTAVRAGLAKLPWLAGAHIWVDGFAGFTGQELETLAALAGRAAELTITLLVDPHAQPIESPERPPDPLGLFWRTERTYQQLVRRFAEAGVAVRSPVVLHGKPLPRFAGSPQLARLEAGLAAPLGLPAEPAGAVQTGKQAVTLLECASHRDELRAAARFLRTTLADSGGRLHFRDFALITRDLEPFAPLVAEVLGEYEIPYFLDRRRPMRTHPLSRLLGALFAALRSDFSAAAMTRLLRTGLLPMSRGEAEELENLAVAQNVHGRAAWCAPTWAAADGAPADAALDAVRLRLMAGLKPLVELARAASPVTTGAVWAQTIVNALEVLAVPRRVEEWIAARRAQGAWEQAEVHRLAWESLCAVLDDLHEVLGTARLGLDEVAAIIAEALREQTLGLAPPTLDQVLVSAIERSRHPAIRHAWVFALNEGVFPARPPEDELLSADDRDALVARGLEGLASHREEAFSERLLAYIAFTRPSESLTINYATVGEDGGPLLPSPLLDDVRRALPELRVQPPAAQPPPACLPELAQGLLAAQSESPAGAPVVQRYDRLRERLGADGALSARLDRMLRGSSYDNGVEVVGNYRPAVGPGVAWGGSPSELVTFLDCPFKHFARYGLRLDAERGPRPLRLDLGSLAHEILADVTSQAMGMPGGVRGLSDEQWLALVAAARTAAQRRLPPHVAKGRPDLVFQSERLGAFLEEVVLAQAERWRRGVFEPVCCERGFGPAEAQQGWPPLELVAADGTRAWLWGRIDRLDRGRQSKRTFTLVYDYKSSTSSLNAAYLTGDRLQLFAYLLAAEQVGAGQVGVEVGGALLIPLYPDVSARDKRYAQGANDATQRMYAYRPQGLFTEEVAPLLDEQLGTTASPVARMRLKKDGSFDRSQSRDVVPAAELQRRLELARQTILLAAAGIIRGEVVAAPLLEANCLACRRCDFRPVCRFDRALNRPRTPAGALPLLEGIPPAATGDET